MSKLAGSRILLTCGIGGAKMDGRLVYAKALGLATAEVYYHDGRYNLFLMGDQVISALGSAPSLAICREEIRRLERMVVSGVFKQAVAKSG